MSTSNNKNIKKYKNLPVWRIIRALCSLICKNNVTWPGWKYKFTKPNIALISQIYDMYFTLCVGCQSLHFNAQKCLIKATTLLTQTQKQTNIQSSQTGSKYHANTARTLSCLTESPHIHTTSYNYILITLNNNKPRRQIWQLFDRRGVCACECKQRVSHAENAHVTTTKLHTSTSNTTATYNLYGLIGLHSYWTSKQKLSGKIRTILHDHVLPGACTFRRRRWAALISGTFSGFPEHAEIL